MNRKMIISILLKMLFAEGILLLLPAGVSLYYGEAVSSFLWVAIPLIIVGGVGLLVTPQNQDIFSKEGFFIVGLVWVLWSACGALPFVIDGCIPNFIDAFFETVSGFTTTGSSIIPVSQGVESLSHGHLFWRSFTHLVGGMGVLVFVASIIPLAQGRSMHILKAEMPGPAADKLVPKAKDTARILYAIYFTLTFIMIVMLVCGGMPIFDSVCNAMGTAGTGGFSILNAGIAGYNSPYAEIVMTVFMCLFSLNFNIYFFIIWRKFRDVARNEEMWAFIGIVIISTALIVVNLMRLGTYTDTGEAIRASAFQVSSVISTSGFATADFGAWPWFSQSILLLLMIVGACAGSTGGGIKVVRLVLGSKIIKRDLRKIARPRRVEKIRMDGAVVSEELVKGVKTYIIIYFAIVLISFLILAMEGRDIITTISSVLACFNNIGPGLGEVGPAASFAEWSQPAKVILSIDMLLGRLEIYPILMLFMPSIWKKKSL